MRYQGGKSRTCKRIADTICQYNSGSYYEPFLGGGSVAAEIASRNVFENMILSDAQPDLILLWQAGLAGWEPPSVLSKEEYYSLKNSSPSALRGWAAFAGSHSGKYFGGYGVVAESAGRDYLDEAKRGFLKKVELLNNSESAIELRLCKYQDIKPEFGDVVYADPPYADSESYGGLPVFNTDRFWINMDYWADLGTKVFVSEFSAPIGTGWKPLWTVERSATLDPTSSKTRTEGLFFREVR